MSKFHFDRKAARFRSLKSRLLDVMANNAVVEFKVVAFDQRGLDGNTWAPNKAGTDTGRQQLVKTGRMRESIRVLQKTSNDRTVGSEVPYAKYHNSGAKNLPKRKFIGDSKKLNEKNKAAISRYLKGNL